MQRHTMVEIINNSRSTALERSVKTLLGVSLGGGGGWGGEGRYSILCATTLALSSVVIYTQDICSVRVRGF